jgi:tetratricopeptide (TPR) repeat protein
VSPASKGPAPAKKKSGRYAKAARPASSEAVGKPPAAGGAAGAGAAGKTDATGLSTAEIPKLPPFWVEWGRALAEKWPMPVFIAALIAGAVVLLTRPEGEPVRSAQEHLQIARKGFAMAAAAQDEQGDLAKAIDLLAGRNVPELAAEMGLADPHGVHGTLPSFDRAQAVEPGTPLKAEDLAIAGEAYYRLAEIKRNHADGIGRRILKPADELYGRAIEKLAKACDLAARRAGPEWHVRRRMMAECQVQLKQYAAALGELQALIKAMTADQAERLGLEKDPHGTSRAPADGSRKEWARVFELTGDCYYQSGERDEAKSYYRLLLSLGESGGAAQRVRLRLAELLMDEATAQAKTTKDEERKAGERSTPAADRYKALEEVCQLCEQVARSDAPAEMREQASFVLGRGSYCLGGLESDAAKARIRYEAAAQAFRYPYSPGGAHLEMSRVLLARSLFLADPRSQARGAEVRELLKGVLRMGASPVIYACAEVSMADVLVESDQEGDRVLAVNGDTLHGGGYLGAVAHIRALPAGAAEELGKRVPELAALLADSHVVAADPNPRKPLPPGGGQLLRIARSYSAEHKYDEAARVYRHILRNYPAVEADRYHFLLGEMLADKARRLEGHGRPDREVHPVLVEAAREFMRVAELLSRRQERLPGDETIRRMGEAWWRAGHCYFSARRYDGASYAFGLFSSAGGTQHDKGLAEALYYQGESLRRMGGLAEAAGVFAKGAVNHADSQFGYLAQLALGETYLEMGCLDAAPEEKGPEAQRNALKVFDAIRRDVRYTPDSQVWMKALFRLGETHYRIGQRERALAGEMVLAVEKVRDSAERRKQKEAADRTEAGAREHLREAAAILEEAMERYPLAKYKDQRESFERFLTERQLPVMRMLATIQMDLEQYESAADSFGKILQATADRTDVEECRREAYVYKGIAEMRDKHPERAAETFQKAHDEFGRTAQGPWFAHARKLALDSAGQSQRAGEWRTKAAEGYAEQVKARTQTSSAQQPKGATAVQEWILPPEVWREHVLGAGN